MMVAHHYREKANLFAWFLNPENFIRMPLHIFEVQTSGKALKSIILMQLRERTRCMSFKVVGLVSF